MRLAALPSDGRFADRDALILLSADLRSAAAALPASLRSLAPALERIGAVDRRAGSELGFHAVETAPGGRLVLSPLGSLGRDHDDVRRFAEAAAAGARRARAAGARHPLLLVDGIPGRSCFARALEVALLGAAGACWEPLEAREAGRAAEPFESLAVVVDRSSLFRGEEVLTWIAAVERGRALARDLGGTEPERMAPLRMAEFCYEHFGGSSVRVEVLDEVELLRREYPLLHAVGRASYAVPRHRPCVVRLSYRPSDEVRRTLWLAGKGLAYDTGGADLKVGGHMAGMSRDKGGAGAVAGFLAAVAALAPRGLAVEAELGCVRNSIGSDAFVTDEIIASHAGKRVRIGNTDAEGRLVLADLLSHLRQRALSAAAPELYSIATLTGHASKAVGPYSIAIENGPARHLGIAQRLASAGELWADPFEISRLRREDWDFVRPRTSAEDVLSCNNAPSVATARGHQFPMAFLAIASGLDEHGGDSARPLPFTHLDIAGSFTEGGDWQFGRPTGAPVPALCAALLAGPA